MTNDPGSPLDFRQDDGSGVSFVADPRVYGERPILEAIHRFTGRCFVHAERQPDGRLLCRVVPRSGGAEAWDLAGQLANEILDQTLRQTLQEETEPIRRLLLAQAFSRTNILHPESDEGDPIEDPLRATAPDAPFGSE